MSRRILWLTIFESRENFTKQTKIKSVYFLNHLGVDNGYDSYRQVENNYTLK